MKKIVDKLKKKSKFLNNKKNKNRKENNKNENKKGFKYENDTLKFNPKKGIPINISLPPIMSSLDIILDENIRKTIVPPLAVSGLLSLYSKVDKKFRNNENNDNVIGTIGALSSLYFMK